MALPTLKPFYLQRKFAAEQAIARRREQEAARQAQWEANDAYFKQADVQSARNQKWGSFASYRQSMEAWQREAAKAGELEALRARRARLRHLLDRERRQLAEEVAAVEPSGRGKARQPRPHPDSATGSSTDRSEQAGIGQTPPDPAELRVRQQQAALWAARKQEQEAGVRRQAADNEARQTKLARAQELEAQAEARRARHGEAAADALQGQILELQERDAQAETLRQEGEQIQAELERLGAVAEERRERVAEKQQVRHTRALRAHYRLVLGRRSREVQAALEADLELLEDVRAGSDQQPATSPRRRREAREQLEAVQQHVAEQLVVEQEREAGIDQLFREEAAQMYTQVEAQWEREKHRRTRLVAEVMAERQRQLEDHLDAVRDAQAASVREREALLADIERRSKEAARRAHREVIEKGSEKLRRDGECADRRRREAAAIDRRLDEARRAREQADEYNRLLQEETARRLESPYVPPSFHRRRLAWD